MLGRVPDQKAFVQELNAVSDVNYVSVHDGLAYANVCPGFQPADFVMVKRAANFQPGHSFRTSEESKIDLVAVILIVRDAGTVQLWPDSVARAVLEKIVQAQFS